MISAATRESEQPKITANGCCAALSSARWSTPCDGCSISPRTNRSFPARSADQASAGASDRDTRAIVAGEPGPCTQRSPRDRVHGGRPVRRETPCRACAQLLATRLAGGVALEHDDSEVGWRRATTLTLARAGPHHGAGPGCAA